MSSKDAAALSSFQLYRRLLAYVVPYWRWFLFGILATALQSGTDAALTWFLKPILDQGFIARNEVFIHYLPLMITLIFLVRGIAGYASNYCMTFVGRSVVTDFRRRIFEHLLHLPARFYDRHSSGHLLSLLLYNVEQITKATTDAVITIVRESLFIIGLLVVMLVTSWKLTILILVTGPLIAMTARYTGRRMRRLSTEVQKTMGKVTHTAEEAIEGYKVIRTFGGEQYESEKFRTATSLNQRQEMKVIATNSLATALVQQIAGFAVAITIYLATSHHTTVITAGGFVSMLAAMLAMLKPLRNITTVSNVIQKGVAAAESIFQLFDQPKEINQGHIDLVRAKGAIQFQNVSFRYTETDRQILQNVSFKVEPGQLIALVGRSGAGKSTLVSLLPHFYDSYEGSISIDGHDIRDWNLFALRRQFALVSQQVVLFNDTIANNIAYGQQHVSREVIHAAAEAAHAMEFIQHLPEGLDSHIGENGVLLSGGQRQRLAMARALLKDAPILILDEATSALDTETERYIQEALQTLMKHRTTLVIAHRLSTVEKADCILVMENGQIIESGTHSELLNQDSHYKKLHQLQFQGQA